MVSVRRVVVAFPCRVHGGDEIFHQGLNRGAVVGQLLPMQMAVVALARSLSNPITRTPSTAWTARYL
jgi:hypothetical protein